MSFIERRLVRSDGARRGGIYFSNREGSVLSLFLLLYLVLDWMLLINERVVQPRATFMIIISA